MDRYLIFQYVRTYMRCALNFGDTCTLRELVVSQRQSETVNGINYIFIFTWRGNALVHRWTQVLQNGKQFVLHYLYTLSYFCLMKMCKIMREERKGLWLQQTQCICDLLWHRYSIAVNRVVMATILNYMYSDIYY